MTSATKRSPTLTIVNLVATAELKQPVSLEKLIQVEGFLYDTAIYKCAYLKDKNTKSKVSIFSTGKMISVGSKSFRAAKHDLHYASRRLEKLELITSTNISVKLQNIVATGDLGHTMDIERLSSKLPNVIYEPEQFPGAIYHAEELGGASILIFASGKVVLAGLRSQELFKVAEEALVKLAQLI